MNRWIRSTFFASIAVLICSSFFAIAAQTEKRVSERDEQWNWQWRENNVSLELKLRGRVEFNDDYTDVVSISPGGSLRIKDERGGKTRRVEITPSGDGSLNRSYSVNGEARPFDREAQEYLARFLNEATQQAGLDAAPRARKILSSRGSSGLLDETSKLHSDYVKRIYFQELIKSGSLDAQSARRLIDQVARQVTSDYEKAQTLIRLAEAPLDRANWSAAYIEATRSITSDYERKRTLSALLSKGNLSRDELLLAIKAASEISSDYEKAETLIKVSQGPNNKNDWSAAYIEATLGISSDYEKARVLMTLLSKGNLSREELLLAVKSAAGMSSDYERARVLIKVTNAANGDEAVRNAVIDAARAMSSDSERERVMKAASR
ncbi:MAG TPA: hypothetical protein VF131_27580 [Blastocatellia bacterium]|nr:hypothetical protein [Blastocatellia bacterium]